MRSGGLTSSCNWSQGDGRLWDAPGPGLPRSMAPPAGARPHFPQDGWGPQHHAMWQEPQHAAPPQQQPPVQWPQQHWQQGPYGAGMAPPPGFRPPLGGPHVPLPPHMIEPSARSSDSFSAMSHPPSSAARSAPPAPPVPDDPASPPAPPPPPPPPPDGAQLEPTDARAPPLPPPNSALAGGAAATRSPAGVSGGTGPPPKPAAPLPPWLAKSAEKRAAVATTAKAAAASAAIAPSAVPDTPASPPKSPPRSGLANVDIASLQTSASSPSRKQFRCAAMHPQTDWLNCLTVATIHSRHMQLIMPAFSRRHPGVISCRFGSAAAPKAIAGNRPFLQKGASPTPAGESKTHTYWIVGCRLVDKLLCFGKHNNLQLKTCS